jgi:hypothetical protein
MTGTFHYAQVFFSEMESDKLHFHHPDWACNDDPPDPASQKDRVTHLNHLHIACCLLVYSIGILVENFLFQCLAFGVSSHDVAF